MKKLLTAAIAILGVSATAQSQPRVETIDTRNLRFTMPTVAADVLEFVVPTRETFDGAPQFHEDEWAQIEFYPPDRLAEIQRRLSEYKSFELKHRSSSGWTNIYARQMSRSSVLSGSAAVAELAASLHATELPAPILTTTSRPLGQVKGGFTIRVSQGLLLYGKQSSSGVSVLAVVLEHGAADSLLTSAFVRLNRDRGLLLVNWRDQLLLVSSNDRGAVSVWRP